jgi:hypothetical protein
MALSRTPSIDSPVREKPAEEQHTSTPTLRLKKELWRGRLRTLWVETRPEVLADLRSKRWQRFLVIGWMSGLLVALVIVTYTYGYAGYATDGFYTSPCLPDGAFNPFTSTYNPWGITGFFQITMGFGSLTFTQAKVIDVIWDIVSVWPILPSVPPSPPGSFS